MPILNDAQLNQILLDDFKDIIEKVSKVLFQKLRDSIEEKVYDAGFPAAYIRYRDDGGLLGSFLKDNTSIDGQTVKTSIYQDAMSMVQHIEGDRTDFVHGSEYWVMTDIRSILTDIIIQGKSGPLFGQGFWTEERDFWTPIIELLNNGEVDRMIEASMSAHGMIWRRI
jgi:hypothetical protein